MSYSEIIINGSPVKLIPLGDCACGCGQKTTISKRNRRLYGMIKGQPIKFILGHNERGKTHIVPKGKDSSNWKGGRTVLVGHPAILLPTHPKGAANGYVHEHILWPRRHWASHSH